MKFYLFILFILIGVDTTSLCGAEPTTQASNVAVGNKRCDEVTLSWTNGDGSWRLILVRENSAVNGLPADNVTYFSNNSYGLGNNINGGNYVCFNNITNNFVLRGLKQNTTYHISIFEHDGAGPDYLTASPTTYSFTTENINYSAFFTFTDSCQFTNNFEFKNRTTSTFGGLQYRWEFGDGDFFLGDSSSHTYIKGGTYTVGLRVLNPRGCISYYALPRKAFCVPRPRSNPREENDDTIQCITGNFFRLIDKTTIDNVTNASFKGQWTFPDGTKVTFPQITRTFNTPGEKLIKYVSETEMNNIGTGCTDSVILKLLVVDNPANTVVRGDTIQCLKDNNFTFDNSSNNLVYTEWLFGDGSSSLAKQSNHNYANTGVFTVIHTATTGEGCSSKDTFPVIVKVNKDASFTTDGPEYCLNKGPAIFTPTDNNGTFFGEGVVNNQSYFISPGPKTITHVVPDSDCPDTVMQQIKIISLDKFVLRDTVACQGQILNISLSPRNGFIWDNGSTSASRSFSNSGTYWGTSTDSGCSYSDTFSLYVGDAPQLNFFSDTVLCKGQTLILEINEAPGTVFNWSNGVIGNIISFSQPTQVNLVATNGCGTSTKKISVDFLKDNCDLFIPNAFSPNNNGRNETFYPVPKNPINITEFKIYNRYGQKVYDNVQEKNKGFWDGTYFGKEAPEGLYIYIIQYTTGPATNLNNGLVQGAVHLIR